MLFPRFLFTLLALDPVHAQPLGIDRFAHIEQALLLGAPFALSPRLLLRPRRLLALIRAGRFVLVVGHRRAVFLELVVVLHEAQQLAAQPALVALEQRKAVARGIVAETPGAHVGGFQLNRAIGRSLIVLLGLDLAQFLLEDPRLRLGQAFELPGEAGDLLNAIRWSAVAGRSSCSSSATNVRNVASHSDGRQASVRQSPCFRASRAGQVHFRFFIRISEPDHLTSFSYLIRISEPDPLFL
jgi:hypothetical protein